MSKAYFARDALSNSGIKEILVNPRQFRYWMDNPKETSSALRMGQAFHSLILEPHSEQILVYSATKTFNSKAGEAFLETYGQTHICVTQEECEQVTAMAQSLLREVKIMSILDACRKEVEIYGEEPTSFGPIQTKAMLDAMNQTSIFDLKTTSESAQDFPYTARRYQYDIQAAWYQQRAFIHDGIMRDFYFVVVEKNPPYGVLMYQAGENFMGSGRLKIHKAVEKYGECKYSNKWPGYVTNEILVLN